MIARKLTVALPVTLIFFTLMASQLQAASVQLSWTAPTTNANGTTLTDLAGYKVYYGLASRQYSASVDVGKTTNYTLSGLSSDVLYYIAVTAYDTSRNESTYSGEKSIRTSTSSSGTLVANFTAAPTIGSAPLAVVFTDTSTGSITSRTWDFGNGTTITTSNLTYTYTYQTPGTYTVKLTVRNSSGATNTTTKTNYMTILRTGLVGAYNFNEGSGTTVNDLSGRGNHGTISGATWTSSGRYGSALLFDGVDDQVRINDASSLDLTNGMTLEAWVYPTSTLTGWQTLIMKQTSGNAVYYLYANSDRNTPLVGGLFASSSQRLYGVSRLATNAWTHVAGTYDGSMQRLFINGTQVAQRSQTGSMRTSTWTLRIGGNSVWGQYFKGRIDEVRIYNRALSATDLQSDRDIPLPSPSTGTQLMSFSIQGSAGDGEQAAPISGVASVTPAPRAAADRSASAGDFKSASTSTEPLMPQHLEIGEIDANQGWKRVELRKSFIDPVVIAKAFSSRAAEPAVVGIRNVDPTGFEISLQPWGAGRQPHAPEMVGYLVIERGRFHLADGTSLESGTVDTDPAFPMHSIAFSQPFLAVPVVITAVTTAPDAHTVIERPTQVSTKGFQVHVQLQASSPPLETKQTISYIAWAPSTGIFDGLAFEVNRTGSITRGQFSTITVPEIFAGAPVFLADIQSSRGGSPVNVRWEQKDLGGIDVKIDDAPDLDADGAEPQPTDVVGYILIR